ncbi:MAG: hypothetical protein U0T82_01310 [Bacteroidales bacterium]
MKNTTGLVQEIAYASQGRDTGIGQINDAVQQQHPDRKMPVPPTSCRSMPSVCRISHVNWNR